MLKKEKVKLKSEIIQWYVDFWRNGKRQAEKAGASLEEYYFVFFALYLFPPAFVVLILWLIFFAPKSHIFIP